MSLLTVDDLSFGYGNHEILKALSFSLEEGKLLGIIGANGCGKTTLLKCISSILPHKGSCKVGEKQLEALSVKEVASLCSYIPQISGISIELTALEVVLMGFNTKLKLLAYPNQKMKMKAHQALEAVGLAGYEERSFLKLSHGQQQLCIFARTMLTDAQLMLLDEPESAMDFYHRYHVLSLIQDWINKRKEKRSAIVTLHDPQLALNFCDEILILDQKRLLDKITPKTDPLEKMEALLSQVYGLLSVQVCYTKAQKKQLVIVSEK